MESPASSYGSAAMVRALRAFVRPQPARTNRCELCARTIPDSHPHLLRRADHRAICACEPCAILFDQGGTGAYGRLPREVRRLAGFRLDAAVWDALRLPIDLAWFNREGATGEVTAWYPSPAGAVRSLLDVREWDQLMAANPILETMQPDVEALLIDARTGSRVGNRPGRGGAPRVFLAPLDRCFRLAGLLRSEWRGLSGGARVWEALDQFFQRLETESREVPACRS